MPALHDPVPRAPAEAPHPVISDVFLDDTLATARRLWVRGRVTAAATGPPARPRRRRWWKRLRRGPAAASPVPLVRVRTEVGGTALQADVALRGDGYFEALFEADLPAARRGWRVARHQITAAGQTVKACSVVLGQAAGPAATVVVLPWDYTHSAEGARELTRSDLAASLGDALRRVRPLGGTVCYLGAVPPGVGNLQPELALAATSLGWPSGPLVLLPAERNAAPAALAAGLDRLRWLFAGAHELTVLNREPAAEATLAAVSGPAPDRAPVARFLGTAEAPASAPAAPWALRPTRALCVPRHPLVFCHGMLAMTMLRMQVPEDTNYFAHLRRFLAERGVHALYPNVEPTGGVAERAEQLRDQINRWTDGPVNVIAHSMGGLDARFLISRLGLAGRVRSLTTVATPHRGSGLADWFRLHFRQRVPLLLALEAFGVNVNGFRDCQTDACRAFNDHTPDGTGVRYFSFGAAVAPPRITPLLRRGWNILTPLEGDNDGLVSVRSARWGEYLGTLSVDHFAQTPDGLFVRPGENFDALGFYSRLVEDLARRGL
jgi:triacylglycerol lipase